MNITPSRQEHKENIKTKNLCGFVSLRETKRPRNLRFNAFFEEPRGLVRDKLRGKVEWDAK